MAKNTWLLFILVSAFLIRLVALNQSLWLDEGTTARIVLHYSFSDIVTKFSPQDFHPPLFYLAEKAWTTVFGYSVMSLRFISVIFSLLTGFLIYLIGKQLRDETTGIWAAAFFLFNPLILYYSQEARMYMMVCFLLSAALYCFVSLQKKGIQQSQENWLYAGLFTATFFSFLTFYGSAFFLLALLIYSLYARKLNAAGFVFFGLALSVITVSPLLLHQLQNSQTALAQVANWKMVLGNANLQNFLLIFIKFVTGRVSFYSKTLYLGVAILWSAVVYFYAAKGFFKNTLLSFLFIIPLICGVVFSFYAPMLEYFRFLYLIIPLSLALSLGVSKNGLRWLLVVGFLIWSSIYLLDSRFHREDWKSLGETLSTQTIYALPSSMDALRYYRPDITIKDLRSNSLTDNQITVIPYSADIYGLNYKAALLKNGYHLQQQQSFRSLTVEEWQNK